MVKETIQCTRYISALSKSFSLSMVFNILRKNYAMNARKAYLTGVSRKSFVSFDFAAINYPNESEANRTGGKCFRLTVKQYQILSSYTTQYTLTKLQT